MQAVRQDMVSSQSREPKDLSHLQNHPLEHTEDEKNFRQASFMRNRLLLIFATLLVTSLCLHASDDQRDGNWWRTESEVTKLNYVVGFFDGMDLGRNFGTWEFMHCTAGGRCVAIDNASASCISKVGESYNSYYTKYFSNVTNDQIVDGLNVFYSDYRNRRIRVSGAVWLVVNGIAGKPQAELDKMIESWRNNADSD